MADANDLLEEERNAVAAASRRLADEGLLIGTAGNVSVREGDRIAVTATGAVLAGCTPGQVTVVGMDGATLAGELEPTSELELHLGIYRRYGAGAVVHTHSPGATALSLVLDELPCVHYQQLLLGGSVRVAPFHAFGTAELAEEVLAALDGRSAALMANHGAVTVGPDVEGAVRATELLEWACTLYWRALSVGQPRVLDAAQQQAVIDYAVGARYGTTRKVDQ
jgi:L-fuculose-phosphate aldolase